MEPVAPNPNESAPPNPSIMKAFWLILLSIAVLGGFGAAGYLLLTGANPAPKAEDTPSSTSPLEYFKKMPTSLETAKETLSELPKNEIEKVPETSTATQSNNSSSDEIITAEITRPTRKKTFKDYWKEPLKLFQTKSFRLDGVMTGNPARVMINRQIVFVGGEIDGARVVQATPRQIILDYEGEEYTLKLGETIEP